MSDNGIKLTPLPRLQVPRIEADVSLRDIKTLAQWCEQTATDYARASVAHATAALHAEVEALRAEVDALREVLAAMVSWFPSADTYRRLGFDPSAPMEALKEAKAALSKELENAHDDL